MNQSLNAFLKFDKDTKIRQVGDSAGNDLANFIPLRYSFPWIWLKLLDAQGKPLVVFFDIQYNGLDNIPFFIDFRRMLNALCP